MHASLVIMAAGLGSRYGGLKQMEGFGPSGERLLEYSVFDAIRAGFERAVFVIRKEMEADFREVVLSRFQDRIACETVFQESSLDAEETALAGGMPADRKKPWGTGHALLRGLSAVDEPFLLMNADDFYGLDAFRAARSFVADTADQPDAHAIIAYRLIKTLSPNGTVSRGLIQADADGRLEGIEERHKIERKTEGVIYFDAASQMKFSLDKKTPVSMNLVALKPSVKAVAKTEWHAFLKASAQVPGSEFGVPDIVDALRRKGGDIRVIPTDEKWMGVTHPDDAAFVRQGLAAKIEAGDYPQKLWA